MNGWTPRTPLEQLIQIETMLAEIVPRFGRARARIVDTLPGHSGRPAGNGEPGGGRGASSSTVVERTQAEWHRSGRDLDRLERLARDVVDVVLSLAPDGLERPVDNGPVRRLAWSRWAVRHVVELTRGGRHVARARLIDLHRDVEHLHRMVSIWADPRTPPESRSLELAADATETLCRSCLRAGARNERSERYSSDGLCRWCGDFQSEQGFLPTLEIIDAHESGQPGSSIARLIREARRAQPRRRRRRAHRPNGGR